MGYVLSMNNADRQTDLQFHIARLEKQAQDAEDREQDGAACLLRARARKLTATLKALIESVS